MPTCVRECVVAFLLLASLGCRSGPDTRPAADPLNTLDVRSLRKIVLPSHQRSWDTDVARLPIAEWDGDRITIRNVRDFIYQSDEDYVVRYSDKTYNLRQLETVDFIVAPFKGMPSLAHTMLSFDFGDGQHLGVSVEARLEAGERYSPLKGALRQYELLYVVADERDIIARRTQHRGIDVYLYPTVATPAQSRELFLDVMQRVNELAAEPEFYDTLTNNCTTNIVRHINRLYPGVVPPDLRVVLPGFSDRLAFDLGLLRTDLSFADAREQAHVNELAQKYIDDPEFSQRIRRR